MGKIKPVMTPPSPVIKEPEKPVTERLKAPAADKNKKSSKKDAAKGSSERLKEVPKEPSKEVRSDAKLEHPKEDPKADSTSNILGDSEGS